MIKYYTRFVQYLAKRYIARHKPIIIGITGSAGKSSAVAAIGAVLTQLLPHKHVYYPSNQLNGELGMPLTIFQIEYFGPTIKYALVTAWKVLVQYLSLNNSVSLGRGTKPYDIIVLEYGVDHVGEMDLLLGVARPDYVVITNIDTVHFGDADITRAEKSKLIHAVKNKGYISIDDPHGKQYEQSCKDNKMMSHIYGFGMTNNHGDITIIDHTISSQGTVGNICMIMDDFYCSDLGHEDIDNNLINEELEIKISINSIESFYLIYTAIGYHIALSMGVKSQALLDITINLPPSRASVLPGINDSIIIDSSYNSSPVGTLHLLDIMEQIHAQHPDHKMMVVIGDMRELYELTQVSHLQLAQRLVEMNIDYVGLVGESTQEFMLDKLTKVYGDHVYFDRDSRLVGQRAHNIIANDHKKYILLVKGSQNTIYLEEAVKQLLINPQYNKLICRQSDWRMIKKDQWFDQLSQSA